MRLRADVAAVGAGATLVVAILLAVVASRHASPSALSPVIPSGGWNGVWVGALIGAFVLYGLGALLARTGRLRLGLAVAFAVAAQAIPLAAPLLLSRDAFLYWSEGRVFAVHHANPYVKTPADFPHDPSLQWVSGSWRAQPAPYGPAWEVVGTVAAPTRSARNAELVYRALAVLALLGSILLVARRTRDPAAVAFLGWSPLLAIHYGGGGHSDALMMLLLLGALALGTTARGGVLWPVASAFKPFPPVLVPLELARRRLAMGRRWWIGLVASAVAVIGISTALFGTHWVHAATTGAHQSSPIGGVHWLTQTGLRHRYAVIVAALVFLVIYAFLLRDAWRRRRARFSLAATALCLTSSLLRPWYALWPVALAAFEDDLLGAIAAYALTGYLLFGDAVQL